MPVPSFTKLGPDPQYNDIVNKINTLVANLTDLMLSLDSLNVVSISAGTVIVYDLDGGPGTITLTKDGMTINNGTTDTFTVDINGNVVMTSALVRSAAGFPRVELNSANTLIGAFTDANNHVDVVPNSGGGTPGLLFTSGGASGSFFQHVSGAGPLLTALSGTSITFQASGGNINLTIGNNLTINSGTGQTGTVYVSSTSGGPTDVPITFTKGIRTT